MSGWTWLGMTKEETGQWKMSDGSRLPPDFELEWWGGRRGLPSYRSESGYDFMMVWCGSGHSYFGQLDNNPNSSERAFICE